jgi:hypothetical protein
MRVALILLLILVLAGAGLLLFRSRAPVPPPPPPVAAPAAVKEDAAEEPDRPFRFDDSRPLQEQVRSLMGAPCPYDKDVLDACRERADAVAAALVVILKDPSSGYNRRETALGMLEYLKASSAVPVILEAARSDADAAHRRDAIRTLGAFPDVVTSAMIRSLYDAARTEDERYNCVTVLGDLGDAKTLPFLGELARSAPDSLMLRLAGEAADKVRILNSPRKEVELVQVLRHEEHPLQEWALARIVAGKNVGMAHHLREEFETHRRLPPDQVSSTFEFNLLRGLRDLGQELSPREKAFVKGFSIQNDRPYKD